VDRRAANPLKLLISWLRPLLVRPLHPCFNGKLLQAATRSRGLTDDEYPFTALHADSPGHSAADVPCFGEGEYVSTAVHTTESVIRGPVGAYAPLEHILREVGRAGFYRTLAAQLSKLFGCDRYLVMRYSQFAKPAFVINNFMPAAARTFYLDDLYRLDPLYGMVRRGAQSNVLTLRQTHQSRSQKGIGEYCEALLQHACIYDELAMLLPLFGGLVIAMCLDTLSAPFDVEIVEMAMDIYPVIQQANRLHLERSLPGGGYGVLDGRSTAVMVTTPDNETVYKNDAWIEAENSLLRRDISRYMQSDFDRKIIQIGESVLHGHRLGNDSPVWSNGNIFFIERRSADSINADLGTVLDAVASRYRLSPRERELFKMALKGCDTRRIAQQLGLSAGTVKNYKQRLYAKLGIKCEREMASLLMSLLADATLATPENRAV
jgi:DNA-binding NarL/FixJ family response regulator